MPGQSSEVPAAPQTGVHRWGMVVDLDRCTGCEACVVACKAENNIPFVGEEETGRGRSMEWIRIERYWEGSWPDLKATFLPVLCQHCTHAPCEPVCPVYATYHNPEGLNAQIYNRCVGTRYCANNCPYDVRFFNWFDPHWPDPMPQMLNPDVTVRSRGVMEKCTFCVQRINGIKERSALEGRPVTDGEVTPACAQTCTAEALVFGDFNDPESRVSRLARDDRRFQLLGDLGTEPVVIYLKREREALSAMATEHAPPLPPDPQIIDDILAPMRRTTWRFWLLVGLLSAVILAGAGAYLYMARTGMGVTGLNRPNMWGMLIANFVFWIGLSHSGTLISAILRLTRAEWRRPVVRAAEAMTIFTIMVAGLFPIIHLGRSWLFYWLVPYPSERMIWPNFRSPLLWDFVAISTYLTGSAMYFYLPLIPDLATVRDRSSGLKRRIYALLSFGWRGTRAQWERLERALSILAVTILPVAVSVHTIVSWDFAMAIALPLWHTTVFGPYFVAGAIYSGLALVITVMAALRWAYRLEAYLRAEHFDKMGKILLTISLIWFYLWWADFITAWYGRLPDERHAFSEYLFGRFWPLSWTMFLANVILPPVLLSFRRFRETSPWMVALTLFINVGMYIERILIVVPPLSFKRFPYVWGSYWPSWVEWTIFVAAFAGFTLLYAVFSKLIPVVSIWEVREEKLYATTKRVGKETYPAIALPEVGPGGGHA